MMALVKETFLKVQIKLLVENTGIDERREQEREHFVNQSAIHVLLSVGKN